MPALIRRTGAWDRSRKKVPRGAAMSRRSPTEISLCRYPLAMPWGSSLTVILQSQRQVLAGARGRERFAVGILQRDRNRGTCFLFDRGDLEPPEPGPGRRR